MTREWFEDYRAAYITLFAQEWCGDSEDYAKVIADHLAKKRAQIEPATELVGMAGHDSLVRVCRLCGQEVKERRA